LLCTFVFHVLCSRELVLALFAYTTLFRSHRCQGGSGGIRRVTCRIYMGVADALQKAVHSDAAFIVGDMAAIKLERIDVRGPSRTDRKSTRLNSSHVSISYAVFCLRK